MEKDMNEESHGIPEGWVRSTFGEVADVIGGGTPNAQDPQNFCNEGGYPWLTPADLSKFRGVYVARGARNLTQRGLKSSSARVMPKGTVLMSSRAPIGYVAVASNEISTNQGFKSFLCSSAVEPEYAFFWLKAIKTELQEMGSGSTFAEISGARAKEIPIQIAPIAEQRRIVAKVEALVGEVDASCDHLKNVPAILKGLRQSILAAAYSGDLTANWRAGRSVASSKELFSRIQRERLRRFAADSAAARLERRRPTWGKPELLAEPDDADLSEQPEIPEEWLYCRLGNLAEIVRGASPRPAGDPRYFGGSIPWITVAELTKDEKVYLDEVRQFVTEEGQERSRFIKAGTLLLTNSGATLGVPKIIRLGGCINDGSVALVDIPLTSQLYLYYFLKSQTRRLRDINQGAAQPNLNTGIVKNILTPLPSLLEQQEIVRQVEMLFALADQIEASYAEARGRSEKLTESILAKAFRGELVLTEAELARQEKRDYEPASVLLERIRGHGDAPPLHVTATAPKARPIERGIRRTAKSQQPRGSRS